MSRSRTIRFVCLAAAWMILWTSLYSCRKETHVITGTLPFNPYDTLNYNSLVVPPTPLDSNSFPGIHQNILKVKCAVPACHDGTFEPDYRTLQSAYNTLVYAPNIKNDAGNHYHYRVVPGDTAASWLYYRITTNDHLLGRMPLYDTLYPYQIAHIRNWIMDGAKDALGNSPQLTNLQPSIFGVVAYLPGAGNMRIDTIRGNSPINPFMVPANTNVDIWFGIYDDVTITPLLTVNQVKFSTNPFGFTSVTPQNLTVQSSPFYAPAFNGSNAPYFMHYVLNTSLYQHGDIVFMRVYTKDADHSAATEIPDNSSIYLASYMSFVVN